MPTVTFSQPITYGDLMRKPHPNYHSDDLAFQADVPYEFERFSYRTLLVYNSAKFERWYVATDLLSFPCTISGE